VVLGDGQGIGPVAGAEILAKRQALAIFVLKEIEWEPYSKIDSIPSVTATVKALPVQGNAARIVWESGSHVDQVVW
jgi:hypothetical protein